MARKEHFVDQGSLAVVYMRNDCDVTYFLHKLVCDYICFNLQNYSKNTKLYSSQPYYLPPNASRSFLASSDEIIETVPCRASEGNDESSMVQFLKSEDDETPKPSAIQ